MNNVFIKVLNPLIVDELDKAGFSYIFTEGENIFVYAMTDELVAFLSELQQDSNFSQGVMFALDNKVRF